ncbi:inner-membrane translocator, partial [mine drainage metagenome]
MKSLPWTFFGGILLGVAEELLSGYLPSGEILSSGLRPAFPFVVLLGLLVFLPRLRKRWARSDDPLAGCDPPPAPLSSSTGGPLFRRASRGTIVLLAGAFVASTMTWISGSWVFTITEMLVFAIVFLSIVLLTGMSGQISLCQAAFVGVGAFTAGQLADHFGLSII